MATWSATWSRRTAGSTSSGTRPKRGREIRLEGFPDRGYTTDGRLLPRDRPGALVTEPDEVARRAVALAAEVDSVCVHGDSPGAVDMAERVRAELVAAGVAIEAFV